KSIFRYLAALIALSGCATGGVGTSAPAGSAGGPAGGSAGGSAPTSGTTGGGSQTRGWRVTTYEHVDLWLHGFALLTSDTGRVPFFARNYKQEITALKRQRN